MQDIPKLPGFDTAVRYSGNGKQKTIPQGAATSLFAALSPEAAEGGKFYDDCHEAVDPPAAPYSLDPAEAKRLWELSEQLVGLRK